MELGFLKSKQAAMEMSVGTIVVIVLSMVVLVLGIFFIQQIFRVGKGAVDSVDAEVQSQIQKLFDEEGAKLAVYPISRRIDLDQGSRGKGIAFSVRNIGVEGEFIYETTARETTCPDRLSTDEATGYVFGGSDYFSLAEGGTMDPPRLISFNIPETAPLCDIRYVIEVSKNNQPYSSADVIVTIK